MTSSTDFMNMQINLKQNQSELAEFMSDLTSWQSDIKEKDAAIRSINEPSEDCEAIRPPVRNIAPKPKAPKKAAVDTVQSASSEKTETAPAKIKVRRV